MGMCAKGSGGLKSMVANIGYTEDSGEYWAWGDWDELIG